MDVHSIAFLQCSPESKQSHEVHSTFVEYQDSSPESTLTPGIVAIVHAFVAILSVSKLPAFCSEDLIL